MKNTVAAKQPGLYTLSALPQRPSIANIALDSGWHDLDQIFKIYPGQFVVCTGIPGSGKSTFVLNLVVNLARRHDLRSYLFVPENEAHLQEKIARIWGNKPGLDKFCATQCWVQSAVADHYSDAPQTLSWVLDQAISAIKGGGVDLLVIDPWNELEWAKTRDETTTEYIGWCLKLLKYFARIHAVTIIVVAHPTKEVGKDGKARVMTLYDIESSAHWYNKCDNGLIVARGGIDGPTKIISAKVREKGAGKIGSCYFHVDPDTEIFTPQYGDMG